MSAMPSILAPLKVFASGAVGAQRAELGANGVVGRGGKGVGFGNGGVEVAVQPAEGASGRHKLSFSWAKSFSASMLAKVFARRWPIAYQALECAQGPIALSDRLGGQAFKGGKRIAENPNPLQCRKCGEDRRHLLETIPPQVQFPKPRELRE